MSSNEPIGFAIVGTGAIAANHAEAIDQVEGAELHAVFNHTPEKGKAFAAQHKADFSETLPELLQRSDVDVVCVTTPSGAHADAAIPALEAGKHVLCEKPLDVTVARAQRIIDAARDNGRILAAVFQSRLSPHSVALKSAIDQGRFGKLVLCSAYVKWWRSDEYYQSADWRGTWALDGGGALMNQSIHYVDLLQWLAGTPETVFAHTDTRAHDGLEVEDTACAVLKFPSGALGTIEASTACHPGYERRIEICGHRGSAILEDNKLIRWDFADPLPEDEDIRNVDTPIEVQGGTADPRIGSGGHRLQVEDLVDAIRNNREPKIPGREALQSIRVIEAIYNSSKTGQLVRL